MDTPSDKYIDSSFKYTSEPIVKGLSLNTRIALSSSLYEDGKHQGFGFGAGPEFVFGNLRNKFFDYSRISIFLSTKLIVEIVFLNLTKFQTSTH